MVGEDGVEEREGEEEEVKEVVEEEAEEEDGRRENARVGAGVLDGEGLSQLEQVKLAWAGKQAAPIWRDIERRLR